MLNTTHIVHWICS